MKTLYRYQFIVFVLPTAFILSLQSCQERDRNQQLIEALHKESFDENVLQNLNSYDSIKNILIPNLDTIFNFNRQNTDGKNAYQDLASMGDYSVSFKYNFQTHELIDPKGYATLPQQIFKQLQPLVIRCNQNLKSITLSADSAVEIIVKGDYDQKSDIEIVHTLLWKKSYSPYTQIIRKDSLLSNNWTYYIDIDYRNVPW